MKLNRFHDGSCEAETYSVYVLPVHILLLLYLSTVCLFISLDYLILGDPGAYPEGVEGMNGIGMGGRGRRRKGH